MTNFAKTTQTTSKKLLAATLAGTMMLSLPLVAMTQTANAAATPADNLTAAKRLNELLANTKSMTANFSQTTKGAKGSFGNKNGTFSGVMSVQRPSLFRWETKSPSEQLVVANGSALWVYDKDLEQATRQSSDKQMGNTPALLLSGDPAKIADNFDITQPNGQKNYYVLYPKSDNSNFKSLALSFNSGKPVMMVLNDSLGQTTSITFSNVKLNTNISKSQFQFTPPKGVDVINQ